jgi:LysR family cyn operon transcriptional activator
MELRHLRYFAALAERLNFTRAAEDVHVTQSTLSHQIRCLEEELGVTLFERSGHRVSLTLSGRTFLTPVVRALREIDDGVITLKESDVTIAGTLSIGATHTFNIRLIPQCVAAFIASNPAVQMLIEELPAVQIEDRIAREQLDVGISYGPQDRPSTGELYFEPLYNEEMVLAVPQGHAFAERHRVQMCELHRQRMILPAREFGSRVALDARFRSVGVKPVVIAEVNTVAPALDLARRLGVVSIASEDVVRAAAGLKCVLIESPKPIWTLSLLWKQGRRHSAAAKLFAEIVKRTTAEDQSREQGRPKRKSNGANPDERRQRGSGLQASASAPALPTQSLWAK